jgi:hypothetical protein
MAGLLLVKRGGMFFPATPDDLNKSRKIVHGEVVECTMKRPNNIRFHRKLFKLLSVAYEHYCEFGSPMQEYKGRPIERTSFDRFRQDLVILAGYYTPTWDARGTMRLEAQSLAFENCPDDLKEQIYDDVLRTALDHVYKHSTTEEELRERVDTLLRFA